ncbi:hypothetical protein SAY86_025106 [Trapa natans]|uniref:E3 ubiquitin-protein ligase RMA n=1 Tax=Trapa natans TaxID=22666 RepID=A0AAN7RIP0_TRANT|nr:hypothetical protein SAY86_025106 [Trapa natans]
MAEEAFNTMNLDLNLVPTSSPEPGSGSVHGEPPNLDNWIDESILQFRVAAQQRVRQRSRLRHVQIPRVPSIAMNLNELVIDSGDGAGVQAGEGSAAAAEGGLEIPKSCDNVTGFAENRTADKDDAENCGANDGSFFDCNICFDLARDPVVTCCGHLFCWPCLYRWLHAHAEVKECPVCKGEVTVKNVTPIYGRGNHRVHEPEDDLDFKIPLRPHAHRVESMRQPYHRTAINIPLEEMIQRLGSRFDLTRDLVPPAEPESTLGAGLRTSLPLERFLLDSVFHNRDQNPFLPLDNRTSPSLEEFLLTREIPDRAQNHVLPPDIVDLAQSGATSLDDSFHHRLRLRSIVRRRIQDLGNTIPPHSSVMITESLVEAYMRNQGLRSLVNHRDSFLSIADIINSESQVVTAMGIDSLASHSTSSSRRRIDSSWITDLAGGNSRASRRRRLN